MKNCAKKLSPKLLLYFACGHLCLWKDVTVDIGSIQTDRANHNLHTYSCQNQYWWSGHLLTGNGMMIDSS